MLKSDRLIYLILLNLLLGFSSGDQTVLKGEGGGAENGKLVGEESNVSTENQKQPKETTNDLSGEQKKDEAEKKVTVSNDQGDVSSDTATPPENDPRIETQIKQEDKKESTDKDLTEAIAIENRNSRTSVKGSPDSENVDAVEENKATENTDSSKRKAENPNESEPESSRETPDTETQDSTVPLTDSEEKLPQQPEGFSTQVQGEILPPTSQIGVKEEESAEKDFETFSEWRQKALAEEEKNKQKVEISEQGVPAPKKQNGKKVNYASKDCGAKILGSNPEAENVDRILTSNKDDYMINPCTVSKKWFVIELCEPIYINEIEAGSFELFSSQPENISVSVSDRYPAKEYHNLGVFTLTETRGLDQFRTKVENNFFVKYVKVVMLTHYGEEHFCPLTMFRAYGIPVELGDDDDDDDLDTHQDEGEHRGDNGEALDSAEGTDSPKNLFSSAKDTVMKLVKKVLNVEEKKENSQLNNTLPLNGTAEVNKTAALEKMKPCEPTADITTKKNSDEPVDKGEIQPQPPTLTSSPAHQEKPGHTSGIPCDEMKPDPLDPVSIVTKLEDHEQMPSEQLKPPMVSLIQSGDVAKSPSLYKMFLSCILPARYKTRKRQNSTLSMCSYVRALKENWFCIPGEFTLPSTCSSMSRSHESSTVTKVITVEDTSAVLTTPSSDMMDTSTERKADTESPCFIPTPVSTADSPISTVSQVSTMDSEIPVEEIKVITKETKVQDHHQSQVLSTSTKTMDKTEIPDVKTTVSVSMENTLATEIAESVSSTTPTILEPSQKTRLEPSVVIEVSTDSTSETPQLQQMETLTTSLVTEAASPSSTPMSADESKTEQRMHLPEVNVGSISTSTAVQMESSQDTVTEDRPTSEEGEKSTGTGLKDSEAKVPPTSHTAETKSEPNYTLSADEIVYTPQKNLRLVKVPILPLQKRETAIMRLTNRIKALETNVSLSSRFLDEMTQKFKKQSEEMQKLLTGKFENVTKDLKEAELRDKQQQEQIIYLEHRLDNLTDFVYKLHDEMSDLNKQVTDRQVIFTSVEVFVLFCILIFCRRRAKTSIADLPPEVRRLIERIPVTMDVSSAPRRNSYTEGASKQKKLLTPENKLQKHGSESSLANSVSVSSSVSSVAHGSIDQQRDFQRRKKKKRNKVHLSKSAEIHNVPEGLKNISTESHNEAGLLFTSNKTELSPTSVPETGSNGLSSYFWKDKQSAHKLAQKRASCPSPPTDRGQQSSKSLNGPRTVKKSVASAECAVPSRVSKNGHCVFVYPVVESLSPTMSCSKPLNGQYSGRPPDKNCAVQSGQSKKKSHKRASSVDLSPRKGDKSVSFW
ncbi:SUN domain-containing ossification factor-like isoform X2 [Ostrea edulis]|uniref:SUN domain-containing ossification factor-like isoform X2 n=1 Tax=Ostrea edulis TaxID=37623 RepID=UPI0024AF21CA|nr:SUN domain-containing ossification factor-like isoform X2 [Ostrea edulis]